LEGLEADDLLRAAVLRDHEVVPHELARRRHILVPLVLAVLVVASWALRPEGGKLKRA